MIKKKKKKRFLIVVRRRRRLDGSEAALGTLCFSLFSPLPPDDRDFIVKGKGKTIGGRAENNDGPTSKQSLDVGRVS